MRLRALATATTIAIGLVLGAAAPAGATNCPDGSTCLWADQDYMTQGSTAKRLQFQYHIPNFGYWTYSGTNWTANNSASSASNMGRSQYVYLYAGLACTGPYFLLRIGTGDGNLHNSTGYAPGGFANVLSSGAFEDYRFACQD